ncbi:hypothetical protein GTP91_31945 [Rugamonas sp. FT82W]|uniref:Uncharacterized protein n=1 Tax=Duganella vulcania TaxID=2692166 RepID=A0A845GEY0_9BURK|nr:hypothetical protein [Duganella vulcania]MYM91776.1 hypothetical protein [Duganella vulcania]
MNTSRADLDVISIAIALLTFVLAALAMSGALSGGPSQSATSASPAWATPSSC